MPASQSNPVNPWLVALTVSLATFMEVMDTSIANVALRHIAGSLAAGSSESTWVLTSYLISNAIILPISGWLASVLGRKRFYMTCVALFTISSFLCGIAPSLPLLLFFRVLQGAGGGGLAPSEQAILTDTFAPEKRGQAFALYGLAVVVAPAIGPALGGWITDTYSWRWIFFINIPVGIVSLILTYLFVHDSPAAEKEHKQVWSGGGLKFDYLGFGFLTIGLGSLQVVLDKGQEDDWFGSSFIIVFVILAAIGIIGMIIRELTAKDPIVDLPLFKNLSFFFTNIVMFAVFFILLSTTQMLPQLVQQWMGYNATKAGLILMPGGLLIMALMPLVGRLVTIFQPKWLMVFGLLVTAGGMEYMTHLDLQASFETLALARCMQAAGLAFLFVPINTAAYNGLPPGKTNNASALINTMRNLGGSIGVSVATTLLDRRSQMHQDRLVTHLTPFDSPYVHALQAASAHIRDAGAAAMAQARAAAGIYQSMLAQAAMLSYLDVFRILSISALATIVLVLFLKPVNAKERPQAG